MLAIKLVDDIVVDVHLEAVLTDDLSTVAVTEDHHNEGVAPLVVLCILFKRNFPNDFLQPPTRNMRRY